MLAQVQAPALAPELVALRTRLGEAVVGQAWPIDLLIVGVLSGGHVLVEDRPGSGKTTLARAMAAGLGLGSARVQGTSDLLPSDITGSSVWNPGTTEFTFVPGPVFAPLLLVDELNRVPPRSLSALLEAMAERHVTVDGVTYALPSPFLVIGTQNPDDHGTHPLPDSVRDRFALRIALEPLDPEHEARVVLTHLDEPPAPPGPVLAPDRLAALAQACRAVHVAPEVAHYAVALVRGTREHPAVTVPAGTRAGVDLTRSARALALLRGRTYVRPDDVAHLAVPALAHRLTTTGAAAGAVVAELLRRTPVPVG